MLYKLVDNGPSPVSSPTTRTLLPRVEARGRHIEICDIAVHKKERISSEATPRPKPKSHHIVVIRTTIIAYLLTTSLVKVVKGSMSHKETGAHDQPQ